MAHVNDFVNDETKAYLSTHPKTFDNLYACACNAQNDGTYYAAVDAPSERPDAVYGRNQPTEDASRERPDEASEGNQPTKVLTAEQERTRMVSWAKRLKLDESVVDTLIEKYGDNAYDLMYQALMEPYNLAKKEGFKGRGSKATIEYLVKREVSTAKVQEQPTQEQAVYSEEERAGVRDALLGVDDQAYAGLAEAMKDDRAQADKMFETVMGGYFKDETTMQLAAELFTSFLEGDGEKGLAEFHQYVKDATKTSDSLNLALMHRANGNCMA